MKSLIVFSLLAVYVTVSAASQCSNLYPEPIQTTNTTELCNTFFVSLFDEKRNRVVLVSERLYKKSNVGGVKRHDAFHADKRITRSPRPIDYTSTGYDRGHMAPSDDASTAAEMYETFAMTNMTPQEPTLNRLAWRKLEWAVRRLYEMSANDVFVVTVAEYNSPKQVNRIPVPTGYWKFVYHSNTMQVFYAANEKNAAVTEMQGVSLTQTLRRLAP